MNEGIPEFRSSDRYRVMEEASIVEQIAGLSWGREIRSGDAEHAQREAQRALDRLVVLGLPFLSANGRRRFDEAEVQAFARIVGERGLDDTFMRRVLQERARVAQFTPAMDLAKTLTQRGEAAPESSFRLALRRSFHFSGERSARARRFMLIPRSDPLHPHVVTEVGDSSPGTKVSVADGYLDIRHNIETPSDVEGWVNASCTIATRCTTPDLSPSGRPRDTGSHECPDANALLPDDDGFVKVTPAIRELAASVVGGEKDPSAIVRRVWDFGARNLRLPAFRYSWLDPNDPLPSLLKMGWSDCMMASALMVAMLRARDIPARLLGGFFLYDLAPTWHCWFEAWLSPYRWVPFDPYSWLLRGYGSFEDAGWGNYFYGALDYRAVFMRFPRTVHARMSLPPADSYAIPCGDETCYYGPQGKLLYGERILVKPSAH